MLVKGKSITPHRPRSYYRKTPPTLYDMRAYKKVNSTIYSNIVEHVD